MAKHPSKLKLTAVPDLPHGEDPDSDHEELPVLLPAAPPGKPPRRRNLPTGDANPEKKAEVLHLLARGHSLAQCSRKVMLSPDTIRVIADEALEEGTLQPPPPPDPEAAARALTDFDFFRTRYFGRRVTPWQSDAGKRMVELKDDGAKEYVVLNVFPGSGKTTLFAHDLACYFAVRDRSLRILIGSRTLRQAQMYTNRLRRTFSRLTAAPVDDEDTLRGLAVQPTGILTEDFGRFAPIGREEMWTADQFVLFQWGRAVTEKEATFTAFGMDSGFLGGRFDVVVWDDLVDHKTLSTLESREKLIRLYEDEVESRLDPGGLLVLQGQRMRTDDLYRHCLDMKVDADPEAGEEGRPKYHHIVYRAHYEDKCRGIETHGKDVAKPWPEGCLLDPRRLPWREVATIRANREEKWAVLYQQEDVDPDKVLVQRVWIDGGVNPLTGEQHPGCWDHDRGLAEIPPGITAPYLSVATCDPSPARYWAIQWWLVERSTERRYLIDMVRQPLEAPEFLDWDYAGGRFTGFMEDWQQRSVRLGAPISHWIVEINAARFLYQHDYVKRWQALHRVALLPHTTHLNRNDKDFGVQTIGPHYRYGRVRLPGKDKVDGGSAPGRQTAMKLVDEVCRWPDSTTDDTVLAHWFLEFQLPRITPQEAPTPKAARPSWIGSSRPNWL
jgi:hypothetical protein